MGDTSFQVRAGGRAWLAYRLGKAERREGGGKPDCHGDSGRRIVHR
ncbi:MAG TPA: hypothetical protein VN688_01045 [Gemmataceae bacterium]|nr:hypothetical protein [Gemmataceae bacterium]